MASLIDESFFRGEINIPNSTNPAILERINWFIQKYEPLCLGQILGYNLHTAFIAGLASVPQNPLMVKIKDGTVYTTNYNRDYKWIGLVDSTLKQSLIANFVYFYYMKDDTSKTTNLGTNIPKQELAVSVSPAEKMIRAWNEFSKQARELRDYLNANSVKASYPTYNFYDYCNTTFYTRPINSFDI